MAQRILITGASVAGNTAARWLGRAGSDVTVGERTPGFREQYVYATGRENLPEEQQAVTGEIFIVRPLLCSLVTVIADGYLVSALKIGTIGDAGVLGEIVGLGFLVPMAFNIASNPLFPRPLRYGLLNTPYFLLANVIACMLLVAIPF